VLSPVTSIDLQGHLSYLLKVIHIHTTPVHGFFVYLKIHHRQWRKSITAVGRHNVSKYFYCCIRSEGLLYDTKRDLLAIAKFIIPCACAMTAGIARLASNSISNTDLCVVSMNVSSLSPATSISTTFIPITIIIQEVLKCSPNK